MNTKNIFSVLLALFGELILVFCFIHFGTNISKEILVLNIIVSSIIYFLISIDFFLPWINLNDKTQKQIGSIGLRWIITFIYIISAITIMVLFNSIKQIHYTNQIIIHCILIFILLVGYFLAFSVSDKVAEVYHEEKKNRNRIEDMKKETTEIKNQLDAINNIPHEILSRINELHENMRFLSPCNDIMAFELETKFIENIKELNTCFQNESIDFEKVIKYIKNCERIYKERKQVSSN